MRRRRDTLIRRVGRKYEGEMMIHSTSLVMANFFKVFKYVIFGGGSRILTNQSERTGLFDPDTLEYRILFFENMKVFF